VADTRSCNRTARIENTVVSSWIAHQTQPPPGAHRGPAVRCLQVLLTVAFISTLGMAGEIGVTPTGPQVGGCSYFVHPDGNDAAPGTVEDPWETFEHAARVAPPGAVVCFASHQSHRKIGLDLLSPGATYLLGQSLNPLFHMNHEGMAGDQPPGNVGVKATRQYSNPWWTVAGGGGSSFGCIYSVGGTVGQGGIFKLASGGSTSVTGGFWAGIPQSDALFADSFECSDTSRWSAVVP
jgi:hypothetical protein